MLKPKNIGSALIAAVTLAILGSTFVFAPARADVAPPESPPGVVISPGTGTTQVRMVSEVVTLELLPGNDQPDVPLPGGAHAEPVRPVCRLRLAAAQV